MLSQKNLNFSLFKVAFWIILHQKWVIITCPLPDAAGNYSNCVYAHWDEVECY